MTSDPARVDPNNVARDMPGSAATGGGHGSWHGYISGYALAALLTAAAFAMSKSTWMTSYSVIAGLCVLAIAQMLVHLIFFLHIDTAPEQRTNVMALMLTLVIVAIVVVGSFWIMEHLRHNMMPMEQLMQMQR